MLNFNKHTVFFNYSKYAIIYYANKIQFSLVKFRDKNAIILFANHFKKTRVSLDITQEQLSYKTDISLSQIARIETAKINPTLCTIIELAKGMDIHPKELLNFDFKNKK